MLNRLILTNLFYFKSNWVEIRAAAPMFIGKAAGVLLSTRLLGLRGGGCPLPRTLLSEECFRSPFCWEGAADNVQVFWSLLLVWSTSLRLAVPRSGDGHTCHVPGWCQHPRNFSPAVSHSCWLGARCQP